MVRGLCLLLAPVEVPLSLLGRLHLCPLRPRLPLLLGVENKEIMQCSDSEMLSNDEDSADVEEAPSAATDERRLSSSRPVIIGALCTAACRRHYRGAACGRHYGGTLCAAAGRRH